MDEWKSSGSGDCIRIRGQTKAIHIRSSLVVVSIYYAINDHALLKSCRYIFRFGQFIYVSNVFLWQNYHWFYPLVVPLVFSFVLWFFSSFMETFLSLSSFRIFIWLESNTLQNHISDYKCGRKFWMKSIIIYHFNLGFGLFSLFFSLLLSLARRSCSGANMLIVHISFRYLSLSCAFKGSQCHKIQCLCVYIFQPGRTSCCRAWITLIDNSFKTLCWLKINFVINFQKNMAVS